MTAAWSASYGTATCQIGALAYQRQSLATRSLMPRWSPISISSVLLLNCQRIKRTLTLLRLILFRFSGASRSERALGGKYRRTLKTDQA